LEGFFDGVLDGFLDILRAMVSARRGH